MGQPGKTQTPNCQNQNGQNQNGQNQNGQNQNGPSDEADPLVNMMQRFPQSQFDTVYVHPQNVSQYTNGGVAICTIMCMQAAIELTQPNLRLSQEKVAQILRNAPQYRAAGHTGVDDILDGNMTYLFNNA